MQNPDAPCMLHPGCVLCVFRRRDPVGGLAHSATGVIPSIVATVHRANGEQFVFVLQVLKVLVEFAVFFPYCLFTLFLFALHTDVRHCDIVHS